MRKLPVRYTIVALALGVCLVSYMDRACIAVATPLLQSEFHLNHAGMGLVLGIFSLAYFLFLTPWGMLADRRGARGPVTAGILSWSVFTTLTAAAWNSASLLAIRFVFGAAEAALSPAVASGFARWVPERERSTAFGAFLSGGRLGGALAPPVAAWIAMRYGWRWMFVAFSGLGVLAGAAWWLWYRDRPAEHPRISPEELALLPEPAPADAGPAKGIPLRQAALSRPVLMLLGVAFGYTFLWQFFITWFPTYLMQNRGMTLAEAARYASLPFLLGMTANWLGGAATDLLSRRWGPHRGRAVLGFVALVGAAAFLGIGMLDRNPGRAALLIACAAGAGDLSLGAVWTAATVIGGRAAGAVSGLMNSASNLAGFLSPVLMGQILQMSGNWNAVLLTGIATDLVAAVLWLGANARPREAGDSRASGLL
jgi:MFS family permease